MPAPPVDAERGGPESHRTLPALSHAALRAGSGAAVDAGGRAPRAPAGLAYPLTAPAMIPEISCLPAAMYRTSTGIVAMTAPASTIE